MKKHIILFLVMILFVALVAVGCSSNPGPDPANNEPDNEPNNEPVLTAEELVETRCTQCHNLDRVQRKYDKERWPDIVTEMVNRSPSQLLNDDEYQLVVDYLQENYGN